MCQQTSQEYACHHRKAICLTPCPHAIDTGTRVPTKQGDTALSRSASTVSSMAQSFKCGDTDSSASQQRSLLDQPLYQASASRAQAASPPPRRVNSSNKPLPLGPSPGYLVTNTLNLRSRWSIVNPDQPAPPATTTPDPSSAESPAPSDEGYTIEPNYCPYYFLRVLPASNYPCTDCYFLPQWEHLAHRYVMSYMEGHPLNRKEDAEKMSGMERLREEFGEKQRNKGGEGDVRKGKLNVFIHGNESVGRSG